MVLVFFTGHNTNVLLREYEEYQHATTLLNPNTPGNVRTALKRVPVTHVQWNGNKLTHSRCVSID
jgi:hypothetical protein